MPKLIYSEKEYNKLKEAHDRLEQQLAVVEELRPHWAKGFTDDGMAAQTYCNSLIEVWKVLGVYDQTACMQKLDQLLKIR